MKILAATRAYETYEDYEASGKFDDAQLKQIALGFRSSLPPKSISLYADPAFDHNQMEIIRMALDKGNSRRLVTFMADPRFDLGQLREIMFCIEDNPPIEALDLVADPKFSADQMHQIIAAMLMDGVTLDDIRVFAKPEFSRGQMAEASRAVEDYAISSADFRKYTQPEYNPRMLRVIYYAIETKSFSYETIDQFIEICLTHDISDINNFTDSKFGYMMGGIQKGLSLELIEYLFFEQPFTIRQLYEILIGLSAGLTPEEVMSYADPKLAEVSMAKIRDKLRMTKAIGRIRDD